MRKLRLTPRLLAGALAFAAVVLGVFYWGNSAPAGSAFTYTAEQRSRYLAEMKENLNGHPESPRYDLVSEQVLVSEGVVACEWLATQPSGDSALTNDELRHLYFQEHPQATAGWPFGHGHTGLREEVLTNSWGWLCEDVEQDHRADPEPVEGD
ncbi:MAG TPA: hypothetical protein VH419_10945 [Nocardioidaceae bacterium]